MVAPLCAHLLSQANSRPGPFQMPLLPLSVCLSLFWCMPACLQLMLASCIAASEILSCRGQILSFTCCDTAMARHFTQLYRLLFLSWPSRYLRPVERPKAPPQMASDMRYVTLLE
jgi:hypothetical protein